MTAGLSAKPGSSTAPLELAAKIAGSGPDLLLIHGGTGSHNHWVRNLDVLATHFRVFAIDLPGFGDSPDVPPSLAPDDYVELVLGAVVRLPLSGGPLRIAGFSFGGVIASALARAMGERVHQLSLIGPAGFGIPQGRSLDMRSRKNTDGSEAAFREIIRHNLNVLMLHSLEAVTDEVIALHQFNIARTRFDSIKLSWRPILLDNLMQLKCPVQILWGEHDRAAYPSVEARCRLCRDALPSARLQVISGAGHWAQFEKPEEVNNALLGFFSESGH